MKTADATKQSDSVNIASPLAQRKTRTLQRACACGTHNSGGGECEGCKKKREGGIQRFAAGGGLSKAIPPIVDEVLSSPGQPLDDATRAFMEPRFGQDFSMVRVHTTARAAASARAVNALAYTIGRDVVFDAGRYQPATNTGRRLLAHELTHVVQQSAAEFSPSGITPEHHASEHEAERVAERVTTASGHVVPEIAATPAAGLQRLAGSPVPVTPQQIAEMRALFQQVGALMRSGSLAAEDVAAITAAETEAEAAILAATEVAAAGATATAVGEGALTTAAGLAADDVTGVGVADDVAIPFVLLAAAAAFGVGLVIGSSAEQISTAWKKAADAVERAVELMRRATTRPTTQAEPLTQTATQTTTKTKEENRRNDCLRAHPYALVCSEYSDMEEEVVNFLIDQGMSWGDIHLDCKGFSSNPPGAIDACDGAPGETWHCDVVGTDLVVSIFACLCCHEDGTTGFEWRRPHISSGSKTGRKPGRR